MKTFLKWLAFLAIIAGVAAWLTQTPEGRRLVEQARNAVFPAPPAPAPPPPAPAIVEAPPPPPEPEPAPIVAPAPVPEPEIVAAPAPPPPPTLEEIAKEPKYWPEAITIHRALAFPVLMDGRVIGSADAPAGTKVKVLSVDPPNLHVGFNLGKATIAAAETDIIERFVASRAEVQRIAALKLEYENKRKLGLAASASAVSPTPANVEPAPGMARANTAAALSGTPKSPASGAKPLWGVYGGNEPEAIRQYEDWLGTKADAILGYTGDASWEDYLGSVGWAMGLWKDMDMTVLWSVPLISKEGNLADAAKGDYNDYYEQIARKLANWRPQEKIIYVRVAWEFNGDWFHYNAIGKEKEFIGAWQQMITVFRKESDRFRFDWCPSVGDGYPKMNPEEAYPGDEFVDVIGLDVYDEFKFTKIEDERARWKHLKEVKYGLEWHRDFAKKHGKPVSFPEWGCGGNEAGDNPYFVEQMHDWFMKTNALYATYWNSNASYPGKLSDGANPESGEMYRKLFGKPAPVTQASR